MITEEEWEHNCNRIFQMYPPPSNIKMHIDCKDKDGLKHFKSVSDFLAYLCLYVDGDLLSDSIHYHMVDDKFYKSMNEYVEKVVTKVKER